ncbi:MAG: hypothetical protein J6Y28_08015 [Acholeplasmatales bacterium]|nr:hypothetical protein [Acholeplasmatales bacterium]
MRPEIISNLEECVLNNGHIMIGYTQVEELLKYIKGLENTKDVLNQKISELYGLINHRDQIINDSIRFKNVQSQD